MHFIYFSLLPDLILETLEIESHPVEIRRTRSIGEFQSNRIAKVTGHALNNAVRNAVVAREPTLVVNDHLPLS